MRAIIFAFLPGGALWVADNAPGRRPERLARSDGHAGLPAHVTALGSRTAPSGIAVLGRGAIVVCGVRSGRLDRYRLGSDEHWTRQATLADDCAYGVARLADGRLAYSAPDGIRVVRP